jgi:hypothetical protein
MVQAINETTTWILLSDAKVLVTKTYQASGFAARLLLRWLAAGRVRWRCLALEGRELDSALNVGDPNFWIEIEPGRGQVVLQVDWSESWARRNGMGGYVAYRIELAREDVINLLPVVEVEPDLKTSKPISSKTWAVGEAQRMRDAGKTDHITKTTFARALAERMEKAAKTNPSIRPIEWRSIFNQLEYPWDIWPIDKIPT